MKKDKNYLENLIEYIIKNLRKGYTKDSLKWALVNQGHSRIEVEKALKMADAALAREAPILRTRPEIKVEIIQEEDLQKKSWFRKIFRF